MFSLTRLTEAAQATLFVLCCSALLSNVLMVLTSVFWAIPSVIAMEVWGYGHQQVYGTIWLLNGAIVLTCMTALAIHIKVRTHRPIFALARATR